MLALVNPGQRSRLFREVNDRIYELLEAGEPDLPGEFLCECGRECGSRVELLPATFSALRKSDEAVQASDCRELRFRTSGRHPEVADGVPVLS